MKIIAVEGLDKSGKHTIAEYLFFYLSLKGYKVAKGEFHNYKTPTGALIKQWLYGEFEADQATIELIMLANKMAQQSKFKELIDEEFDYLILDRYTASQDAYVHAYTTLTEKNGTLDTVPSEIVKSVQPLFIQPDYTVYLAVSPETSMARKGKHGVNDRYESDLELLSEVQAFFETKSEEEDSWFRISAEEDLSSVKTMVNEVMEQIEEVELTEGIN